MRTILSFQKNGSTLGYFGLGSAVSNLQTPIGGHHPVQYFQIQETEKYSTVMRYPGPLPMGPTHGKVGLKYTYLWGRKVLNTHVYPDGMQILCVLKSLNTHSLGLNVLINNKGFYKKVSPPPPPAQCGPPHGVGPPH